MTSLRVRFAHSHGRENLYFLFRDKRFLVGGYQICSSHLTRKAGRSKRVVNQRERERNSAMHQTSLRKGIGKSVVLSRPFPWKGYAAQTSDSSPQILSEDNMILREWRNFWTEVSSLFTKLGGWASWRGKRVESESCKCRPLHTSCGSDRFPYIILDYEKAKGLDHEKRSAFY